MRLPFVHTAIDALDTLLAITCPIRYTLSGSVIGIRLVKLRLTGLVTFLADAPLHAFYAEVIKFFAMIHRSSPILWKHVLGVKLLGTPLDPPFDIVLVVATTIGLNGVTKILAIPDGITTILNLPSVEEVAIVLVGDEGVHHGRNGVDFVLALGLIQLLVIVRVLKDDAVAHGERHEFLVE